MLLEFLASPKRRLLFGGSESFFDGTIEPRGGRRRGSVALHFIFSRTEGFSSVVHDCGILKKCSFLRPPITALISYLLRTAVSSNFQMDHVAACFGSAINDLIVVRLELRINLRGWCAELK